MPLKVGIIGGGNIASHHIRGYLQSNVKIVMVADAQESIAKHRGETLNCQWTNDYHQLLKRDDILAVSVCVPNWMHFEVAKAAVEAGKAVLCEKPMTTTLADSEALVNLVKEKKTYFQVGYMKRFHPVMKQFKTWLPLIGTPLVGLVRCYQPMPEDRWGDSWFFHKKKAGGGVLTHGGSHTFDLLHWVLGDVNAVTASITQRPGKDIDWVTGGLLEMANGAPMLLETGWIGHANAGPNRDGWDEMIQIRGVNGILTLSTTFWDRPSLVPCVECYVESEKITWNFAEGPVDSFVEEIKEFVRCVSCGDKPAVTVEDGYWVDRLLHTLYESSQQRARISLV